jgi:hypothetical protein
MRGLAFAKARIRGTVDACFAFDQRRSAADDNVGRANETCPFVITSMETGSCIRVHALAPFEKHAQAEWLRQTALFFLTARIRSSLDGVQAPRATAAVATRLNRARRCAPSRA